MPSRSSTLERSTTRDVAAKKNKPFLLRIDASTLDALQRMADEELRSLNGEIEWLLRESLRKRGRLPPTKDERRGPA